MDESFREAVPLAGLALFGYHIGGSTIDVVTGACPEKARRVRLPAPPNTDFTLIQQLDNPIYSYQTKTKNTL